MHGDLKLFRIGGEISKCRVAQAGFWEVAMQGTSCVPRVRAGSF